MQKNRIIKNIFRQNALRHLEAMNEVQEPFDIIQPAVWAWLVVMFLIVLVVVIWRFF